MSMGVFRVKCGHKATYLCKEPRYGFCRMVAEWLRQQWHDLASSPGSGDEARLSLSFNWMLLAPTTQLLLHKQELGITTLLQYKSQCPEVLFAWNQNCCGPSGFEQSILVYRVESHHCCRMTTIAFIDQQSRHSLVRPSTASQCLYFATRSVGVS